MENQQAQITRRRDDPSKTASWKDDFKASIVVFLVALPLCMGIAIASGVPPQKAAAVGILTGIIGGIIVGSFAGSPLLVTGPAAGLSVLVYDLVQKHGWQQLGFIVLLAGALQVAASWARLGQWFRAVSPAVIHGMLAGIGVLILASQFHIMLDDVPRSSGLANVLSLPEAVWMGILPTGNPSHEYPARIGILTILILVLWKYVAPKRLRVIPAPLAAVIAATLAVMAFGLDIKQVQLPDDLRSAIGLPVWPAFNDMAAWSAVAVAALSIAFIASAETLLSAAAVDQMHQGSRTRYDRELAAQGLGNMVCGFLGGLPMTGVIVRSAANVTAGAKTNKSAIMHGVWLLLCVALFPFVLRYIPTASLAAILVYTGWKLVDFKVVRRLAKFGKSEVFIYFATVGMIVGTDLLTGVVTGFVLSVIKLVITFSRLEVRLEDDPEKTRTVLNLEGAATFICLPKLAASLEQVQPNRELHVQFDHLDYIDHACLDLLMNWEKQHQATGGSLVIDWYRLRACFHEYSTSGKYGLRRKSPGEAAGANASYETPEVRPPALTRYSA